MISSQMGMTEKKQGHFKHTRHTTFVSHIHRNCRSSVQQQRSLHTVLWKYPPDVALMNCRHDTEDLGNSIENCQDYYTYSCKFISLTYRGHGGHVPVRTDLTVPGRSTCVPTRWGLIVLLYSLASYISTSSLCCQSGAPGPAASVLGSIWSRWYLLCHLWAVLRVSSVRPGTPDR